MKFDVIRNSHLRQGLVGLAAPQPLLAAYPDEPENRWLVDVEPPTLSKLFELTEGYRFEMTCPARFTEPTMLVRDDLVAMLLILDTDDRDE